MKDNIASYLNILRKQAAYFLADEYGLLSISGKDAAAYLQSQSSNDLNKLLPGHGQLNCLLDRKARVLAYFHIFKDSTLPTLFYLIAEKAQIPDIVNHLEQLRFAAEVEFSDLSQQGKFIAIAGPRCNRFLCKLETDVNFTELSEPGSRDIKCGENTIHIFRLSVTGNPGYFLWIKNNDYPNVHKLVANAAQHFNFSELSIDVVETARIEAGLPRFNIDFSPENLLTETGLEANTVSYSKGCFTGQEVLARVKSHGMPAKALIGLIIEKETKNQSQIFPLNTPVFVSDEEIGILKSNVFSLTLDRIISLAFLKRDYRVAAKKFIAQINGESVTATVIIPPFVSILTENQLAQNFYEQAVQQYIKEDVNALPTEIIFLLQEALAFDPKLEDAYEALAVILGKHDQLDEAIALMKKLAELNPDSVMAHSNLSQFYVQQGNKELAEEEKAIALGIRMRLAAAEVVAESKQKEAARKDEEETKRRMSMFEQVLTIDSEDFFANAGLGECLVEMKEYDKSVQYLKKAISVKANHMPAYIALAKAYKESGSLALSKEILQQGIALASKRGDKAALQQMQDSLSKH